jgi:hypothetical protein
MQSLLIIKNKNLGEDAIKVVNNRFRRYNFFETPTFLYEVLLILYGTIKMCKHQMLIYSKSENLSLNT